VENKYTISVKGRGEGTQSWINLSREEMIQELIELSKRVNSEKEITIKIKLEE
jgi:hypothetical protein